MGGGTYSYTGRTKRAVAAGYDTKPREEIFKQRQINNAMCPYSIKIRESRDSKEHPNSLAIILALDVTGSMGSIPHYLVKNGLPNIMDGLIKRGVADPQVLFLGIGDHTCDEAPLQVGQFESSDELLDHWLTNIYIEGHGGGNDGESYMLAWYFAAYHTAIDCLEKRGQKGLLFTIGDEPVLEKIPRASLDQLMKEGQHDTFSSTFLLDKAREKYIVRHLHIKEGANGRRQEVMDGWKQLMADGLIIIEDKTNVADIIVDNIVGQMGIKKAATAGSKKKHEDMML